MRECLVTINVDTKLGTHSHYFPIALVIIKKTGVWYRIIVMTTRVIPISAQAMTDFLERHEPTWERFKEVTDDTMIESDYGYGVDIIGNTKSSEMLFNACLDIYAIDEETDYADMSIIANLIRDANQGNGNILVCSSSHVQDLCDNAFKMSSCELSTQSFFYNIVVKNGWKVAAMGLADDCPFTGSDEFEGHFCLVRDVNDSALARLNEFVFDKSKSGIRLGALLQGIFEWNDEEKKAMEKLKEAMENVIRSHDELDQLLEKQRLNGSFDSN